MRHLSGTILLHIKDVKGDVPRKVLTALLNGSLMSLFITNLSTNEAGQYAFKFTVDDDVVLYDDNWSVTMTHPRGVVRVIAALSDLVAYASMGFHLDHVKTKRELEGKGISVANGYYHYSAGLVDFGYFLVDLLDSKGVHQAVLKPDQEYTLPYLPALRKGEDGVALCYMTESQSYVFPTLELALLDTAFKSPKAPIKNFNLCDFVSVQVVPKLPGDLHLIKDTLKFKDTPSLYK